VSPSMRAALSVQGSRTREGTSVCVNPPEALGRTSFLGTSSRVKADGPSCVHRATSSPRVVLSALGAPTVAVAIVRAHQVPSMTQVQPAKQRTCHGDLRVALTHGRSRQSSIATSLTPADPAHECGEVAGLRHVCDRADRGSGRRAGDPLRAGASDKHKSRPKAAPALLKSVELRVPGFTT
jgi:hypothetical protein